MMLNNKGTNINHSGMRRSNGTVPIHSRTYAYTYSQNIRLAFADGTLTSTNTYQRTKHFPNRNQYAIPFYIRSSFAISSAAVYANGAVDTSYDYAVPELGTVPLLNQEGTGGCVRTTTVSSTTSDKDSLFSKNSSHSTKTEDKKVSFNLNQSRFYHFDLLIISIPTPIRSHASYKIFLIDLQMLITISYVTLFNLEFFI